MTDKIILFATCPSKKEGKRIAQERLVAYGNGINGVVSVYHWQGKVEEGAEVVLVVKSRRDLEGRLRERLASMHSYEVPEAIAIPVVDGLPAYLEWLDREIEPLGKS